MGPGGNCLSHSISPITAALMGRGSPKIIRRICLRQDVSIPHEQGLTTNNQGLMTKDQPSHPHLVSHFASRPVFTQNQLFIGQPVGRELTSPHHSARLQSWKAFLACASWVIRDRQQSSLFVVAPANLGVAGRQEPKDRWCSGTVEPASSCTEVSRIEKQRLPALCQYEIQRSAHLGKNWENLISGISV